MLQQGDSSSLLAASSGDVNAAITAAAIGGAHDGAGVGAADEDTKARGDDGDRSFGGHRWPRQETLALLKIRSNMDQVFRDSSLKGPLWEDVSRKLAELGYHRSAKKCKEKFENVYKYHKRTKEGRTGKPEGKHYKFFDQLEALDHRHHHHQSHSSQTKPQAPLMQATVAIPWSINPASSVSHVNVSISAANPINVVPQNTVTPPPANPTISATPLTQATNTYQSSFPSLPSSYQNVAANLFSSSTSSSTASDEESKERGTRKRKWKVFFKRLTKEVIKKQEELQNKFLEEIERRERDRIICEEAWRVQEMSRINREHEILIQERSTAAAKDAAVIAFLQKISGQQKNPVQARESLNPQPSVQVQVTAEPPPQPQPQPLPPAPPVVVTNYLETTPDKPANGENIVMSSSSRWPKAEVQALIRFRTDLANKYQENGPKGPLWEEISAAMRSVGYNRSAKRCKEKWENINKYFKKVKDSNKRRPGDSKTCPYFNQLDALYEEKSKTENSAGYGSVVKTMNHNMAPLMVQPEQQWPLHQQENHQQQSVMSDIERDNADQIQEDDEETEEEYEEEGEEGNGYGYEILANKPAASMGNTE